MPKRELNILAPTAILGYGYPEQSLKEGLKRNLDAIAVDAGSTDAGPYYLGITAEQAYQKSGSFSSFVRSDLEPLLLACIEKKIPLIIGSAGVAGADLHLMSLISIVRSIAAAHKLNFKMATIWAQIEKQYLRAKIHRNQVSPLGPVAPLSEDDVDQSIRFVAQMGTAPFIQALEQNAQVIIAGRANDPSIFAALALHRGFDPALSLHMAKILECGAIACEPGSGSDCLLGTLREDHFILEPMNPNLKCTTRSVAGHTLYEKSDPFHLDGPEGRVHLERVRYRQISDRAVKVEGSTFTPSSKPCIKIEGAKCVGFRSIAVSGIRDPELIANLDGVLDQTKEIVAAKYGQQESGHYQLIFHVYGQNAVMKNLEPKRAVRPHEVGLIFEVVASTQDLAQAVCSHARSNLLHMGFTGRLSTAGNLAFPFSPLDIPAGPVCEFSGYHLVEEPHQQHLFPIEYTQVENHE